MNSRKINSIICSFLFAFSFFKNGIAETDNSGGCFCKLKGRIDDCSCKVDTVDHFNNIKLYPVIQSLLISDFFRYIKVNLNRGCHFWPDDSKCVLQDCSVKMCSEEQLPPGLKGDKHSNPHTSKYFGASVLQYVSTSVFQYFSSSSAQEDDNCDDNNRDLGYVNETISDENKEDFLKWQKHDDTIDNFCVMDDETSSDMKFVDLLLNPERFTGYKGPSAHRIWNSIYKENCFKFSEGYGPYTTSKNLHAMCLEKRAFYRAISGLHSSISIHLCAQHYTKAQDCFSKGEWGPNLKDFKRRFDPTRTGGEGPHWLKNLYFVYLLELRAIVKAAPYLENELFYTGNLENDRAVQLAVKKLIEIAKSFPDHFDEKVMFSGNDQETRELKEEFRMHFRNISRIMDCVGCDKCRLWGKIQVQGLGTAFKILFSEDLQNNLFGNFLGNRKQFRLTRTEVVSLINAFGRLSDSIHQLQIFREMLDKSGSL